VNWNPINRRRLDIVPYGIQEIKIQGDQRDVGFLLKCQMQG